MKRYRLYPVIALVAGVLLLAASCRSGTSSSGAPAKNESTVQTEKPTPSGPVTITAADREQADKLFATRCATCHGADARGDGPAGAALDPKPQNFHDETWQKATSDETIETAIVYGGAAVGKSPAMAPNPDLQAKPGVVKALREKVRTFGE